MTRRVYKQAFITIAASAALSAFFEWKKWPVSIVIGGLLGLANFKAMAWGVEGLIGTYKASGKLLFFSIFRLLLLIGILAALLSLKLVNILGVLVGFTVVFVVIVKEGLLQARQER